MCFHLMVREWIKLHFFSQDEHRVLHRLNTNNRKAAMQICDTFKWYLTQTNQDADRQESAGSSGL